MSTPTLKRSAGTDDVVGVTVLDTTGALGATPAAPGGDDVPDAPVHAPDEQDLRALRASLVDETLRLRRWQRLVQARLDLATDRLSPAEALLGPVGTAGRAGVGSTPAARAVSGRAVGVQPAAPATEGPADLVALVRGRLGADVDAADDLRAVVATHRALHAQALVLAGRLAEVDHALAGRGRARRCCPRG